jgi:hypothetical protein|tara:strand:+ start:577 stop:711 length:135 start_codon:yes stop_codon:yes gene_type:complete
MSEEYSQDEIEKWERVVEYSEVLETLHNSHTLIREGLLHVQEVL